jgi:hypothetical protein
MHDWVQECEDEGKSDRKSCWKSGGGRVRLYTWPRVGLADEAGSDAIPDAAGGEGGYGTARADRVIHRCIFNRGVLTVGSRDNRSCV